jgi:hypothetical protein
LAELFFEILKLSQGALPTPLLFYGRTGRREGDRWLGRGFRTETNAADVEVFLEAVQLEEIGEFEGADVATGVADFLLEVAHDLGQVGESEASAEELEPEPLPVKTAGEVLSGEAAIGLVQLLQLRGHR